MHNAILADAHATGGIRRIARFILKENQGNPRRLIRSGGDYNFSMEYLQRALCLRVDAKPPTPNT
jgi:hypothetical protein